MRYVGMMLVVLLFLCSGVVGAQSVKKGEGVPGPKLAIYAGKEPNIRVRIGEGKEKVVVGSGRTVKIGPTDDMLNRAPVIEFDVPVEITRVGQDFYLKSRKKGTIKWALRGIKIEASEGGTLDIGKRKYPRVLVMMGCEASGKTFDVINHVPIEEYLPGVLARELFPDWDHKAFEAQAIAARSYALWEMTLKADRPYDLESTEASQAYVGKTTKPLPLNGVKKTRGMVMEYGGRIVPAFYSSAHGGIALDVDVSLTGKTPMIPPLRGGNRGDFAKIGGKSWKWDTVRDRKTLTKRIAAYCAKKGLPGADLKLIKQIGASKRNKAGRPIGFRIVDIDGRVFEMTCEQMKWSCNYSPKDRKDVPALVRGQWLKSSFLVFKINKNKVKIYGRGNGHGVGMSQWGAQGMALKGYNYQQILQFYYPGMRIVKLYK